MECTKHNTAAVILAAGSSGRMGIPKALLKTPAGCTFLETEVQVYLDAGLSEIVVVVNPTVYKVLEFRKPWFYTQIKLIVNSQQENGRLFSIMLGLEAVQESQYAFIQNVDQPFLSLDLAMRMMRRANPSEYVVPAFEGNAAHPLLCGPGVVSILINSWSQAPDLRSLLESSGREMVHALDPLVCENINTPGDYLRVFGKMPE